MKMFGKGIALVCFQIAALMALGGCLGGSGGTETQTTTPSPPPPPTNSAPTISGAPSSSVKMGEAYSFTPSASDPDNDPLSFSIEEQPNWLAFDTTDGSLTGTPQLEHVGSYSGIVITVSDGSLSSSLPQFGIEVTQNADGTITLSWTAPTQNEDGSPLTDLAAYRFYYGTSPGNYTESVRVDSPGITTYVLENLSPATYYIVATAINSQEVESTYSNEASKQVL